MMTDPSPDAIAPWSSGRFGNIRRRTGGDTGIAEYAVSLPDGRSAVLTIYPEPLADRAATLALWQERLADAAFPALWPLRSRAGRLAEALEDGTMAVLSLLPEAAQETGPADPGTLGALLADLHLTSADVAPDLPPATLPTPPCTPTGRATGPRAAAIPADRQGAIHGTPRAGAWLVARGAQFLAGFSVAGRGPLGFDLAAALPVPASARDLDTLLAAYGENGGSTSPALLGDIALFLLQQAETTGVASEIARVSQLKEEIGGAGSCDPEAGQA